MSLEPESHSHPHGTGIKWVDLTVAISAIFISVVSLVVSIGHGRTMEKLVDQSASIVAASTLPILQYSYSQIDAQGRPSFSINVKNGGVGPAVIGWLDLRYKGESVGSSSALLERCCASSLHKAGKPTRLDSYYTNFTGIVIGAKEVEHPLVVGSGSPELAAAMIKAQPDLEASACYCSVLKECWITHFNLAEPVHAPRCDPPKGVKPW